MFSFFKKIRQTSFLATFTTSYNWMKDRNGASNEEALQKAISVLAHRRPFNVLTEDDISFLAKTFATLPDPKILGMLLQKIDKDGDATSLKKRDKILGLIESIRKNEEAGK